MRKLHNCGRSLRYRCSYWRYFLLLLFLWSFMLYSPLTTANLFLSFVMMELKDLDFQCSRNTSLIWDPALSSLLNNACRAHDVIAH
jgi:hypothetical protein